MDIKIDRRALVLFVVSLLLYITLVYLSKGMISAPDDLSFTCTALQLVEHHSFVFEDRYNEEYNTNVFAPRSFVYVPNKGIISIVTPGTPILIALFSILLLGNVAYVLPLIAAFGVVIFYYFVKEKFGRDNATISSILLSTLPIYWHWSIFNYSDVPSVIFFILGLFYLERIFKENDTMDYIIGGIIIGFWLWLRPTNFILLPAIGIYIALNRDRIKNWRGICLGVVMFLLFSFGFLFYNNSMFGSFFTTGYQVYYQPYPNQDIQDKPLEASFPIHPKRILRHMYSFPMYSTFALPFYMIAIIGMILSLQHKRERNFAIFSLLVLISLIGFFGNLSGTYGSDQHNFNPRSSYLRYLMPGYVLMLMYAYHVIEKLFERKVLIIIATTILISSNIAVTLFAPHDNLSQIINQRNYLYDIRSTLLDVTNPDDIIFTAHYDKTIFPDRTVFGYHRIPGEIRRDEMLRITKELLEDGKKIYFIADIGVVEQQTVLEYLNSTENILINEELRLYGIKG